VQADRYTLSELKLIQDRWPHPRGRVLPTMLAPIDLNKVPAYLRAVTICKPKGNLAAEVAYEVSRMGHEIRRAHGDRREGSVGGMSLDPVARGAIAALALGALTILTSVLANQLAPFLTSMGLPKFLLFAFHGVVLSLTVWLAALLFGVRDLISFGVLAGGCIAAYEFELAFSAMRNQLPALYAGKSMIFALFAAVVLPCFRTVPSWASLAVVGLIAGQLALSFKDPFEIFIWEALLVATVAFFLAFTEPDVARAS
jgi:hypothetical protein